MSGAERINQSTAYNLINKERESIIMPITYDYVSQLQDAITIALETNGCISESLMRCIDSMPESFQISALDLIDAMRGN